MNSNTSIGINHDVTINQFNNEIISGSTNLYDAILNLANELSRFEAEVGDKYMQISGGTLTGGVTANTNAPFTFNASVNSNVSFTAQNGVSIKSGATIDGKLTMNGVIDFPSNGNNITAMGSAHFNEGGFQDYSDIRLKNDIKEIDIDIEKIAQLPTIYFKYIGDNSNKERIGTIAQEIKKIFPQIVHEDSEGYLYVDYHMLSVVSLYGIKKLNEKMKKMESDIELIKSKLNL